MMLPRCRWHLNQALVFGVMYDEGRIVPEQFLVVLLGPLSLTWRVGRGERRWLYRR